MAERSPLWDDVLADLETASRHAARAVARAKTLKEKSRRLSTETREEREHMVGRLIHDCYSCLKAGIERLVKAIDGEAPVGGEYHTELINRAARKLATRPPLIAESTATMLQRLRSFRHAYRHSYGHPGYDYARAVENVPIAAKAVQATSRELKRFAEVMGLVKVGSRGGRNGRAK